MAKDKSTDYSKLTLGAKIPVKKIEEVAVEKPVAKQPKVDEAVSHIHKEVVAATPRTIKPTRTEERTLRVTLDIPLSLHAQIRTKTFQDGISMKEYFLEMAKKDLNI